ncbi:MAG: hypothetical protein FRX49_11242 [Trebouxia sp. A1-2]|nr:MAG: hypothetical protein FRX49_11242 [Trebouxia sp. A1-2]
MLLMLRWPHWEGLRACRASEGMWKGRPHTSKELTMGRPSKRAEYLVDFLLTLNHAHKRVVEPVLELGMAGKDLRHEEVTQVHHVGVQGKLDTSDEQAALAVEVEQSLPSLALPVFDHVRFIQDQLIGQLGNPFQSSGQLAAPYQKCQEGKGRETRLLLGWLKAAEMLLEGQRLSHCLKAAGPPMVLLLPLQQLFGPLEHLPTTLPTTQLALQLCFLKTRAWLGLEGRLWAVKQVPQVSAALIRLRLRLT